MNTETQRINSLFYKKRSRVGNHSALEKNKKGIFKLINLVQYQQLKMQLVKTVKAKIYTLLK